MNIVLISFKENLAINGLKHIALVSEKSNHKTIIVCPNLGGKLNNHDDWNIFSEQYRIFVTQVKPDIIGISYMSYLAQLVEQFARLHRSSGFMAIPLIGGGVHPTVFPEDALNYLDAIVMGEGELSFGKLLEQFSINRDLDQIQFPGIYTKATFPEHPLPSPFVDDLDTLEPLTSLTTPIYIFAHDKILKAESRDIRQNTPYNANSYDLMASRGCPLDCSYCCNNVYRALYGKSWLSIRKRSVAHVMIELRQAFTNRNLQFINFHDDSFFSHSSEWLREFVDSYTAEINLPIIVRVYPGSLNDAKLAILKSLPFLIVSIGLQTGSWRILKEVYKRPIPVQSFVRTTELLNPAGILYMVDVLLNNPYESEDDVMETISLLLHTKKPYLIELNGLQLYPGTELQKRAIADHIINCSNIFGKVSEITSKSPRKNYLNKIIYVCPHVNETGVRFLLKNQSSVIIARLVLPLLTIGSSLLNAMSLLKSIRKASGSWRKTLKFLYHTSDFFPIIIHLFPFLRRFFSRRFV